MKYLTSEETIEKLKKFEERYSMSSAEMYAKWGKLEYTAELGSWYSLYSHVRDFLKVKDSLEVNKRTQTSDRAYYIPYKEEFYQKAEEFLSKVKSLEEECGFNISYSDDGLLVLKEDEIILEEDWDTKNFSRREYFEYLFPE